MDQRYPRGGALKMELARELRMKGMGWEREGRTQLDTAMQIMHRLTEFTAKTCESLSHDIVTLIYSQKKVISMVKEGKM